MIIEGYERTSTLQRFLSISFLTFRAWKLDRTTMISRNRLCIRETITIFACDLRCNARCFQLRRRIMRRWRLFRWRQQFAERLSKDALTSFKMTSLREDLPRDQCQQDTILHIGRNEDYLSSLHLCVEIMHSDSDIIPRNTSVQIGANKSSPLFHSPTFLALKAAASTKTSQRILARFVPVIHSQAVLPAAR